MKKTVGTLITESRKEKGLTQAQLAEKMGVTDKAVSKWERDQTCPDMYAIPKLAEVLGISVEQLVQGQTRSVAGEKAQEALNLILKATTLAMGVGVIVLTILEKLDTKSGVIMLAIGMISTALYFMQEQE